MVKIEHNLKFVTEVDETHPVGMQLLALEKIMKKELLEGMIKDLLAPYLQPEIDRIN